MTGKGGTEGAPPAARLTYYPGADYAAVQEVYADPEGRATARPQRGGGLRGKVGATFNKNHRRNMRKRLSRLRLDVDALYVTATYPDSFDRYPEYGFPTAPSDYGGDLRRFLERIEYRFPEAGAVWRLEYQEERGAPHYHLLVYGVPFGTEYVEVLEQAWSGIVGAPCAEGFEVSVLQSAQEHRNCRSYISKIRPAQISSPCVEHEGSSWGVFGKKYLPEAEAVVVDLQDEYAYHYVRRTMRRYRQKHSKRKIKAAPHNPGLTVVFGGADVAAGLHGYIDRQYPAHDDETTLDPHGPVPGDVFGLLNDGCYGGFPLIRGVPVPAE